MKKKLLVNKVFLENRSIIEEDMKRNNLTKKQAISKLTDLLNSLCFPLHLEDKEEKGKTFRIKEVQDYLPVKLGFYEISNDKPLDPEEYVQQCLLIPTEKGQNTYVEYKRLNTK